jgi:hypothetical protein
MKSNVLCPRKTFIINVELYNTICYLFEEGYAYKMLNIVMTFQTSNCVHIIAIIIINRFLSIRSTQYTGGGT